MEHVGVPVDMEYLTALRDHWSTIQERLIERIDESFGIYDGRTFKAHRFRNFLATHNIPWPYLASGALALDDDTFRHMAQSYPILRPLRELRVSLSQMHLSDLAVGPDGGECQQG